MDEKLLASRLAAAYRTGRPASPDSFDGLTLADGYRVQDALVAAFDDAVVGYKLGFTNETVQTEVGVTEPVYGRLFAETVGVDRVDPTAFVAPRAEPEIVVRLGDRVPAGATRATVADSVAAVAPAVEIVDSRTGRWTLDPGPAVADNALAARLAVGPDRPLDGPLSAVRARITCGETEHTGYGSAVLGDPLRAVAWLAEADGPLPADTLVSTGSLTATVPLAGSRVRATFDVPGEQPEARVSFGTVTVPIEQPADEPR